MIMGKSLKNLNIVLDSCLRQSSSGRGGDSMTSALHRAALETSTARERHETSSLSCLQISQRLNSLEFQKKGSCRTPLNLVISVQDQLNWNVVKSRNIPSFYDETMALKRWGQTWTLRYHPESPHVLMPARPSCCVIIRRSLKFPFNRLGT